MPRNTGANSTLDYNPCIRNLMGMRFCVLKSVKQGAAEPNELSAADPKEMDGEKPKKRTALFGLVKRKEKWVISVRGWLTILSTLLVFGSIFIFKIHPFLAVTERVETPYLVVEGWVPNYALREAVAEFKSRPYQMVFTVGADALYAESEKEGDSLSIEAYKRLQGMGMNQDQVKPVPAHVKYRNRTFQSAVALKNWAETNHVALTNFNLVTLGPHARRSRLLFEKAFEGRASVGIISVEHREYDPKHWWKYSEGVREIIGETVGYVYARFLFHPDKPSNQ